MPLLYLVAKAVAVFRGPESVEVGIGGLVRHVKQIDGASVLKPDDVVLAVEPPVVFGDVVIGAHLEPGDVGRVHQALKIVARHKPA